jgi:UDP-glucose 4-epimerase
VKNKVLITGGAGYIGSVIASYLLDNGFEVALVDDLSTGNKGPVDISATFHQGSILDESFLIESLNGIDTVIHCAAKSLVGESFANAQLYSQVNTDGTDTLLKAMAQSGVNKIIFSSTAAVYGDANDNPLLENSQINPINPYGQSKYAAEQLVTEFVKKGKAAVTFRYFNVAGSYKSDNGELLAENHQNETHLIPKILKNTLRNGVDSKVEIYGDNFPTKDGTCIRDYLHVQDLAHAHLLALEKLEMGVSKVFNLGSGVGYSVLEVLNEIEKVMGVKLNRVISPARKGDPAVLLAAIGKAMDQLGWEPESSLNEIISSSWQGMKQLG